jgi:hypothetical protein
MASFLEEMDALPSEIFDALGAPTITVTRTVHLPRTDAQRDAGKKARVETTTFTTRGFRKDREVKADDGLSTTETTASILGLIKIDDVIQFEASDRTYKVSSSKEMAPDGGEPSMCKVVMR